MRVHQKTPKSTHLQPNTLFSLYFIFSNKPITIKFILVVIQQPLVHSGRDKLQFGAQLSGPNSDPVAQTKFSKTR